MVWVEIATLSLLSFLYTEKRFRWSEQVYRSLEKSVPVHREGLNVVCISLPTSVITVLCPVQLCRCTPMYANSKMAAPQNQNSSAKAVSQLSSTTHCCFECSYARIDLAEIPRVLMGSKRFVPASLV